MDKQAQFLQAYRAAALEGGILPVCLHGQYALRACLKSGPRSVYLLEDQAGWKSVLKTQPSGQKDSLREEYALLRELCHPQIPRALAYLEEDGREYLIREYVEGTSLADCVADRGPLSPEQAAAAAVSVCRVLEYLHSQSPPVICRDVKPQNVVMDAAGNCHLIDLGAARRCRQEGQPDLQGDTVLLGTRATAPPEQFGYRQTDQRADIYGVGMLLRFLLTGGLAPLSGPRAPRGLARVEQRCTAFDPKDRYPSAAALIRALRRRRHGPAVWGVAAAVCLAAVLASLALSQAAGQVIRPESPLLAAALRRELGLEADDPIPAARLGEVEQLLLCGETLPDSLPDHAALAESAHDRFSGDQPRGDVGDGDLALLRRCVNLQVLVLDYQNISDLSPLAGLPLEHLSVAGNQIADVTPLLSCPGLRVLDLGENPVRSLETLAQLPELRELDLEATGVISVDALAGTGLETLNLWGTAVADYRPLARCPGLHTLITGDLPGGAADTLGALTGLEELRLYSTPGVDLAAFSGLVQLRRADFFGCTVAHGEALAELPALQYLNLGGTNLTDLAFLAALPVLGELDLREIPASDFSPLLDCAGLGLLVLGESQRDRAAPQLVRAPFEIQYWPG